MMRSCWHIHHRMVQGCCHPKKKLPFIRSRSSWRGESCTLAHAHCFCSMTQWFSCCHCTLITDWCIVVAIFSFSWDFDVFSVCKLTNNRPLFFLGLVLFRKNDLISKFAIEKDVLCNFLNCIEAGYRSDLPYHNSTHAADVTRSLHFFLHTGGPEEGPERPGSTRLLDRGDHA